MRPIIFGEVLFDHFPSGQSVLGGAPFNVCRHLSRLGDNPLMVSRIGDDPKGKAVQERMQTLGLDASGIQIDPERPTGRVTVEGPDRFEIPEHQAWDRIEDPGAGVIDGTGFLYAGSLAIREGDSRIALNSLYSRLEGKMLVDVNLRDPWWSIESCFWLVSLANILKVNEDEWGKLYVNRTPEAVMDSERLDAIVITRGAEGVEVVTKANRIEVSSPPVDPLVDTVGAGDAVSAMVIHGTIKGWGWEKIASEAASLAADVCRVEGAELPLEPA